MYRGDSKYQIHIFQYSFKTFHSEVKVRHGPVVGTQVRGVYKHCFAAADLDNRLTTLSPTKCTVLSPDISYYNITLNAATCFYSYGIIIRESH